MEGKPKRTNIPEDKFLKLKEETELLYKGIKPIHCPYLKRDIAFNVKGLDHVKFNSWGRIRNRFDQYTRLKLFYLVPGIISKSHTLQGLNQSKQWERKHKKDGWEQIQIDVNYYEFISVIGKARIKIIVKQLPGGEPYFWSIIPFWKMGEKQGEKKLFDGNPEED